MVNPSLKELKKKLSWWGSVFWNAPRLHPVCNKPWDQTKQNATEPRTKNVSRSTHRSGTNSWCTSCLLEYRLRYDQLETLIEMWRWAFENRELCLYHPGKMKIISIQSDTELLSLSRPYSSVYVERKTFMWVTIQGVKIQREKKKYIPFSVSWIHSQTLQDTYTRTSEIEKISERVLRDSNVLYLPTQHTYVPQTPPTSFIYVYAKSVKSWGVHRMCGVGFRTLAPSGAYVWKCFFFCGGLGGGNPYDLVLKIWN